MWEVDRKTGAAKIIIPAPEGQADDIAVGPNNELAWTNYLMGMVRYRENDTAPLRILASFPRRCAVGIRCGGRKAATLNR